MSAKTKAKKAEKRQRMMAFAEREHKGCPDPAIEVAEEQAAHEREMSYLARLTERCRAIADGGPEPEYCWVGGTQGELGAIQDMARWESTRLRRRLRQIRELGPVLDEALAAARAAEKELSWREV
jgi:hypothetical protein